VLSEHIFLLIVRLTSDLHIYLTSSSEFAKRGPEIDSFSLRR